MSPRRRSHGKRGYPANLYERNGYFSWKHPETGIEYGIGRDQAAAFAEAIEANLHVRQITNKTRLVHQITGEGSRTVGAWNERYQKKLAGTGLKPVTLVNYVSTGRRMVRMLGADTAINTVTALQVTQMLDAVVAEGHPRTAQKVRAFMRDSFREAKVDGWFEGDNPVVDTKLKIRVKVMRARLTLEVFMAVYQAPGSPTWFRNAIALALVTGQRREDIAHAQFRDFREGAWWLTQSSDKGRHKHHIRIPTALRLDALGLSLEEVVSRCRHTGVLSKYLVHLTESRGGYKAGQKVNRETITRHFTEAVEALGLDWEGKTPPTLHEIRSLSERLYAAQGGVNTQELLGHSDAKTTAVYHDSRGHDWTTVTLAGRKS